MSIVEVGEEKSGEVMEEEERKGEEINIEEGGE